MNPRSLLNWLGTELFPFEVSLTWGERIFFRIFEALVCAWTLEFAWTWAPYIQRIESVVLPLGVANYVDVSILFSGGGSYIVAAATTALLLLGFVGRMRYAYPDVCVPTCSLRSSRCTLASSSLSTSSLGTTFTCWYCSPTRGGVGSTAWRGASVQGPVARDCPR